MKIISILFIFCSGLIFAQEEDINQFYNQLQNENISKEERFQLLDTLAILTENANFHPKYEEVALQCVQLGLELKKFERTAYQTVSVLYYYNNIAGQPEKGIPYADAILAYKDSIPSNFKLGILYQYLGDAYYFTNQNEQAISDYNKSEYYFEQERKPNQRMIALTRSYRAGALSRKGEFVKATTDLQNAIEVLETTTDTFNIVASRYELSILFSDYQFYEKAEEQRQEIIKLGTSSNSQLAAIYVKKANDEYEQGHFEAYEKSMLEALDYAINSDRRKLTEPKILLILAQKYHLNGQPELGEKYAEQFFNNFNKEEDFLKEDLKLYQIAKSISDRNYKTASDFLEEYYEEIKSSNNIKTIYKTQERLAKVYAELNQFEKAFQYEAASKKLKDSIETDQKLKSLSFYQTQFETERKEKELQAAEASLDLVALQSKNNKRIFSISLFALLLATAGIFIYRNRLQIKKEEALQRQFAQDLIQAQDHEREIISSNLHDSLGQSLVLLKKQVRKTKNQDLEESVSYAIEELRGISRNIYPPILKKLGLSYTLEQLTKQVFETTAIQFDLALANIEDVVSPKETLNLYRFIQEALSNTLKHAEATEIRIAINRFEDKIEVEVNDNGKGFAVEDKLNKSQSLGLLTLKHRIEAMNGTFSIISNSKGTQVKGEIPF